MEADNQVQELKVQLYSPLVPHVKLIFTCMCVQAQAVRVSVSLLQFLCQLFLQSSKRVPSYHRTNTQSPLSIE